MGHCQNTASDPLRTDLALSLVLLVAMVVGSTLWTASIPPLFIAYILAIGYAHRFVQAYRLRLLLYLSYALTNAHFLMILGQQDQGSPWLQSMGFAGLMLLWSILVAMLLSPPDPPTHRYRLVMCFPLITLIGNVIVKVA